MSVTLHQNVVCIEGGKALYYLHSSYYDLAVPDFDTLSPVLKQRWTESAQEAIVAVGPPRTTRQEEYLAGFNSAKVVGAITPGCPWGESK